MYLSQLKNKIIITILVVLLSISGLCFSLIGNNQKVLAYAPEEVTISNGNFDTFTGSDYPKTVSSWTPTESSSSSSLIKKGVISTDSTIFVDNHDDMGINTNPLDVSDNILMINSQDQNLSYGYKSTTFDLDKDSYYKVSVDLIQSKDILAYGSIYLNVGDEIISFENKVTSETYTFYTRTNQFSSETASLELWLGGKTTSSIGAIFYDNATCYKISENEYNSVSETSTIKIKSLASLAVTGPNTLENGDFALNESGWTSIQGDKFTSSNTSNGVTRIDEVGFNSSATGVTSVPLKPDDSVDNNGLYINNKDESSLGYKSTAINILQGKVYALTFYAKANISTGTANAYLKDSNIYSSDDEISKLGKSASIAIATSATNTNSVTNNWDKYTFYIKSSMENDTQVYLELWLGSKDSTAKGYVFFDSINLFEIDYSTYTDNNSSINSKSIELKTYSTSSNIPNAYFNLVSDTSETTYPLLPKDWSVTKSSDTFSSGIISTRKANFDANNANYGSISLSDIGFTSIQQDKTINATNNVLMIRNDVSGYQNYKSNTYSLTANSYYTISVEARTKLVSGSAYIKFIADNNAQFAEFTAVNSNDRFTTYTAYIATGLTGRSISVELGLGKITNEAIGYAFFDNVIVSTIENEEFTSATTGDNNKKADLTQDNFTIYGTKGANELFEAVNWTGTLNNSISIGDSTINAGINENSNGNELTISSISDVNYQYTQKLSETIDSSKFYSLTVSIKTNDINQSPSSKTQSEDNNVTKGAKLWINDTYAFSGIDTNGEYADYTFYFGKSDISSYSLSFSLGYTNALTSGSAKIKNISLNEITEDEFNKFVLPLDSDSAPNNIIKIVPTPSDDTENTENAQTPNNTNFDWVAVPSIIMGLAVILTIIGAIVIKTKKKIKPITISKNKTPEYDRNKTVELSLIRSELNKVKILEQAKLNEQIEQINIELNELESYYKERVKELKVTPNSQKELTREFNSYAKSRKKLVTIQDSLKSNLEKTNSVEYLRKKEGAIRKQLQKELEQNIIEVNNITPTEKEIVESNNQIEPIDNQDLNDNKEEINNNDNEDKADDSSINNIDSNTDK